jgi:type IV fimbrial biogenesis protein FimT
MTSRTTGGRLRRVGFSFGFTLIELLVVLAIASVLAGVAVPSFRALLDSIRLTSASNDLFSSLLLARGEAVKRNGRVALCKSGDGVTCAATGGWEQGWLVFHDMNNDGQHDESEEVLQRAQSLSSGLRLRGNMNVARYISYTPGGTAKLVSGAFQAGTITMCNASSGRGAARQIVLSAAGRPRVQRATVESCT